MNEFINKRFKNISSELAVPLMGFDDKLKRRNEIEELIKKMDTEKKQIEQEVKLYMKEAETAQNNNFLV